MTPPTLSSNEKNFLFWIGGLNLILNAHILPSVGFNYTLDIILYSEQTKARESTQKAHLLWTSCAILYQLPIQGTYIL